MGQRPYVGRWTCGTPLAFLPSYHKVRRSALGVDSRTRAGGGSIAVCADGAVWREAEWNVLFRVDPGQQSILWLAPMREQMTLLLGVMQR